MGAARAPQRFGGYELHRLIGVGGMAEVFLGRPLGADSGELVVVKRMLERLRREPRFVAMFRAEAERSALLDHPNVVRTLAHGEHEGWPFMVMEYVHGRNLRQLVQASADDGGLPVPMAVHCVAELLKGLEHTHRARGATGEPMGLIHRDVTPDNACICFSGEVKLADFGVAHRPDEVERRELRGKFGYVAPEVLDDAPIDQRSDIFSAGVVLWELLARRPFYSGETGFEVLFQVQQQEVEPPSRHNPQVTAALDQIVCRALQRDPAARFQSAAELARSLEAFLDTAAPGWGIERAAAEMRARFGDEAAEAPGLPDLGAFDAPAMPPVEVGAFEDSSAQHMLMALRAAVRSEVMAIEEGVGSDWDAAYESAIVSKDELPPVDEDFADVDTEVQRVGVLGRSRAQPAPLTVDALIDLMSSNPAQVQGIGPLGEAVVPAVDCARLLYWDALGTMPTLPQQATREERFADISLTRLLFELSVRRMTGTLELRESEGGQRRVLLLDEGRPLYVYSDDGAEGVLAMLFRLQLLTPALLFHGLERALRVREPLECALVSVLCAEDKAETAEQLPLMISGVILRRLYPAFAWREGGFRVFDEQLAPNPYAVPLPSLLGCFVHGARSAFTANQLFDLLQGRGARAAVLSEQRAGHLAALRLGGQGQRIVDAIDGERGLLQILRRAEVSDPAQLHGALALLYTLVETRIAELI